MSPEPTVPSPPTPSPMHRPIPWGAFIICILGATAAIGLFSYAEWTMREAPPESVPSTEVEETASPDLSGILYATDPDLLPEQGRALLAENGFVVVRGYAREFFPVYEDNRYRLVPSFITADSVLHNYHLLFDTVLRQLEEQKLIAEARTLTTRALAGAAAQARALKGTSWENAAGRNVGFFAVAARLLDPDAPLPPEAAPVREAIDAELALIAAHGGIAESPLMNAGIAEQGPALDTPQGPLGVDAVKEDYSQYVPRGHYDKSDDLKVYFKALMWYGRMTFVFNEDDRIRSAALLTTLVEGDPELHASWLRIYEPTVFLVGKSDDPAMTDLAPLLRQAYGSATDVRALASNAQGFTTFKTLLATLTPPVVNSIPIFNEAIQPDKEKAITGLRFMGQRYTVDADIMQHLVDRAVPGRMLPRGLDIPAALGSDEALALIREMEGDTYQPKYGEMMGKLRTSLAALDERTWTQNVYWGWVDALRSLLGPAPEGAPAFMRSQAWVHKSLATFLGSWTELKHDTILYAKQVYAELGGGGDLTQRDDRGYVEPNPALYGKLGALAAATRRGLEAQQLLAPEMADLLDRFTTLAGSLEEISRKELQGTPLTEEEYELIRSYGGQIEHIWLEANKEEIAKQQGDTRNFLNQNPSAVVADVATDPNGSVLEEGTGWVWHVYAAVPVAGSLRLARGGVYSQYEFVQPLSGRLTDAQWWKMLEDGMAPERPAWTASFVAPE